MAVGIKSIVLDKAVVVDVVKNVNRIICIDCSGSMSSELPKIRHQLKNKLPQLVNVGDTVSIIWFSGRDEAGVLMTGVPIRSITDFTSINSVIDKWLKPVGLTGFVDPLQLVNTTLNTIENDNSSSLLFLTDGYDNSWKESQILDTVKNLKVDVVSFVEFGYYCNRSLMVKMAEAVGGNLVFNDNFEQYDETFSNFITTGVTSAKKIQVKIPDSMLGYAYFIYNNEITSVVVENGVAMVPEYVTEVFYMVDRLTNHVGDEATYAGIFTTSQRMLGNVVFDLLAITGDVRFYEMFANCFSKQDYAEFQTAIKSAVFDGSQRYVNGQDHKAIPKDDAFTVIDMLEVLSSDSDNKFHPYNDCFKYHRIGVAREQKSAVVTDAEKHAVLDKLKMAKTKEDMDKANAELTELLAGKTEYVFTPDAVDGGYPISLTYNESRANINILFRVSGTVGVDREGLPSQFPTFIYRNYTMVKDGIKHSSLDCLPFELSPKSFDILKAEGVVSGDYESGKVYNLNVKKLPIINRKMVESISAEEFFINNVELTKLQSAAKVFNTLYKNLEEKKSVSFADTYGQENADWLKSIGVTDYNGFNPPSVKGEVKDVYKATEFNVKIAKCSSIPTINDKFIEKATTTPDKLTLSESLCYPALKHCLDSKSDDVGAYKKMLLENKDDVTKMTRAYIKNLAKDKFTILVGHVWFKEFASMDENTMTVTVDGKDFVCTAEVREIDVEC